MVSSSSLTLITSSLCLCVITLLIYTVVYVLESESIITAYSCFRRVIKEYKKASEEKCFHIMSNEIVSIEAIPNAVSPTQYLFIRNDPSFSIHNLFYSQLNEYHIRTEQVDSIINYSLNNKYLINPIQRLIEYAACNPYIENGNGLSIYWGSRALAYWMNYNWRISKQCLNNYNKALPPHNKMRYFLSKSDMVSLCHNNNNITSNISNISNILLPVKGSSNKYHETFNFIHPTSLLIMYFNRYYQKIVNYELMSALNNFYKRNNRTQYKLMNNMSETNDIVIHIRCGDVLQKMRWIHDFEYGFLTIRYYKYVINILENAKSNKLKYKIRWDTNILILSQLTTNSLRDGEKRVIKHCNYLIKYLINNGFKKIFNVKNINIIYNSDENDDYYRMINAPLLFCSPSSFCFNAAIANINGIVIIPSIGPWIDLKLLFKNNTNHTYDDDDYIIAQNSKLLPPNMLIVDTKTSAFHCNEIDNYHEKRYNIETYTEKLAEYLINH